MKFLISVFRSKAKFTVLVVIALFACLYIGQQWLSAHARETCGPLNPITDADRDRQRHSVLSPEMQALTLVATGKIVAANSDPVEAWCVSKRMRNVRIKVGTLTEVDRNVEHYLWARAFVSSADLGSASFRRILTKFVAVPIYSIIKLPHWAVGGSPPTLTEFFAGQAGADAGFDFAIDHP